jgi:hypothetical protein
VRSAVGLAILAPRLTLRALDDLHRLAEAAERLPDIERTVISVQRDVVRAADEVDARLTDLLAFARRLELELPALGIGLTSLQDIAPSVDVLTEAARTLAATVQPLRGASERLGRLADRLPGAVR